MAYGVTPRFSTALQLFQRFICVWKIYCIRQCTSRSSNYPTTAFETNHWGLLTITSVHVRDFLNFCTKVMNNTVVIFDKTARIIPWLYRNLSNGNTSVCITPGNCHVAPPRLPHLWIVKSNMMGWDKRTSKIEQWKTHGNSRENIKSCVSHHYFMTYFRLLSLNTVSRSEITSHNLLHWSVTSLSR